MKRIVLMMLGLWIVMISEAKALTMKGRPIDYITNPNGHITVGFEKEFGGAISYYRDDRIPDEAVSQGNLINNSNSGALFSTAVWTLKNWPGWDSPNRELGLGWCDVRTKEYFPKPSSPADYDDWIKYRKECYVVAQELGSTKTFVLSSLPFNNPTQGGVNEYAWGQEKYGVNPNIPIVFNIVNNRAKIMVRMVNFNYSFEDVHPSVADENFWQTDVWNEMEVYFRPEMPDVLVVDQKIRYEPQMDDYPKDKELLFQDNQLSTLFPAQRDYDNPFTGPITKQAYRGANGFHIYDIASTNTDDTGGVDVVENWEAALTNEGLGLAEAIYRYRRSGGTWYGHGDGYGAVGGVGGVMVGSQPDLAALGMGYAGIRAASPNLLPGQTGDPRYYFSPGGWYKFRTFITSGNLANMRKNLLMAQEADMNPGVGMPMPRINNNVIGHADVINCSNVFGWAAESGNAGHRVQVKAVFTPVDGGVSYEKIVTADADRGDGGESLKGVCPPDGLCGYGVANGLFPAEFIGKKLKVRVWGTGADGGKSLLTYSDGANSVIGPCSGVVVPSNTPVPPTKTPTPRPPTPTPTPTPTVAIRPTLTVTPTVSSCSNKKNGDADCNGAIDLLDFGVWKRESLARMKSRADFDNSGRVTVADFEIWRYAYLRLRQP